MQTQDSTFDKPISWLVIAHLPERRAPGAPGRDGHTRPMPSAVRLHQALLAAAVLVPAALFAAAAWHDRAEILREGADTVARTTAIMHEHARKVFETETLLLSLIEEIGSGMKASPAILGMRSSSRPQGYRVVIFGRM